MCKNKNGKEVFVLFLEPVNLFCAYREFKDVSYEQNLLSYKFACRFIRIRTVAKKASLAPFLHIGTYRIAENQCLLYLQRAIVPKTITGIYQTGVRQIALISLIVVKMLSSPKTDNKEEAAISTIEIIARVTGMLFTLLFNHGVYLAMLPATIAPAVVI